jgi:hypothetical protein
MAEVYVNLRPCGCRHLSVPAAEPKGLETMPAKITGGWSLNLLDGAYAERLPVACDICMPVRQEQLF